MNARSEQKRLKAGYVVVRHAKDVRHDEPVFDEVVAYGATVHLEKMNDSQFCLIVYGRKETVWFMLGAKRALVDGHEYGREPEKGKRKKRPTEPTS